MATDIPSPVASRGDDLPGVAHRGAALGTDSAFELLAAVNRLRSQGRDVISFGIGEPDVQTPAHVVAAAQRALDDGYTKYGPSNGLPQLRDAIAAEVARTRRMQVNAERVVVAPGAKPLIFYAIAGLVDEGEDVVYPSPGFPAYESLIRWFHANPVPMPLRESRGFACDREGLDQVITDRTKLIILNSPNNPTGSMLDQEDLAAIASLARRHNCWVLSDEIYSRLVLRGAFESIATLPGMQDRTIIVDGFSKTYAMTGWRLGYGVMNPDIAELLTRIETNVESCTCTFTQIAGLDALQGPQTDAEEFVSQLRQRANLVVRLLNEIDGIHCLAPRGAFYAFPNVTGACRRAGIADAEQFAQRLLFEAGVAVLPRSCFGARTVGETDEYVRLSFATSIDLIREGIARIARFVQERG